MLKAINTIVQTLAKFLAFSFAFVFTFIAWFIFKINRLISFVFALVIYVVFRGGEFVSWLISWIMWVPAKIAQYSFMFALDISPQENKERIDSLFKQVEKKIEEYKALHPEPESKTDFQLGQENMQQRVDDAIVNWFDRDRMLPANGHTAQTIQELIRSLPIESEEQDTENDSG